LLNNFQLDYVIVTGDLISHDFWNYGQNRTLADINNITALLRKYFPKTKVFEAVGNHEGVPQDA
jgi:predicted MPP superfamily phosphohydrolase